MVAVNTRKANKSLEKDYSKDTRPVQEIILDIMAEEEAFRKAYGSRDDKFTALFQAGKLPQSVILHIFSRGLSVEYKRLSDHPAIAERARVLNPDYDSMVAERQKIFRKQFAENQAKRAARPLTAKERAAKEKHEKIMEDGRKTWAEIEAAVNFYHSFKLADGTKLVHATKEKLIAEAEAESSKARKHGNNASFYKAIVAKMPKNPKVTVGEAMTAEDISAIRQRVF